MNTTAIARSSTSRGEATVGDAVQYLTFTLAGELFAVPIETIREVIEYSGLTRIPLAPAALPGVLNLRGAVIPVVDLSVRFGRAPMAIGRRTCVIIVETATEEGLQAIGVIVDAVSEALEVARSQVELRPAFGSGLRDDFVSSMLNVQGRFVIVLDMKVVLSMEELEQLVLSATSAASQGKERVPELPRLREHGA
jgi:purine-binding chemotaxis protein CheW